MRILGISAFYHDSAAALVEDGRIVAAAQEERFSRVKHDMRFPRNAIAACLEIAGCDLARVDYVTFYDKPFLKFERLLETYLAFAPKGFTSFRMALPLWIREKLFQKDLIIRELRELGAPKTIGERLRFAEHHQSHAASAFYPSPFSRAAVLTMDGVGEWATTSMGIGSGNKLDILREIHFPHSLGLLYSAFTYHTGFKVNSGEYKLMGLAPYGEPKYVDRIRDNLIDLKEDGSFRLNMNYFDYCTGLTMTNGRFDELFGRQPRAPETPITQHEMDMAASIQAVLEDVVLRLARSIARETGEENLCLAGGVALNCVANGKLQRDGCFSRIWIQPAAGDAGGALGAALAAYYQHLGAERTIAPSDHDMMSGAFLGPEFDQADIERRLKAAGARFDVLGDDQVIDQVAEALSGSEAVGWFQGRMEFGPRALGGRSILGDPRAPDTQKKLNLKIKFRESFRPFAPSILAERARDYFDLDCPSPYMLLVADVLPSRRKTMSNADRSRFGIDLLNVPRSDIPAVTHVDYSARIQTVHRETNPRYYRLLEAFYARTGCPLLVNTSFNVRGEPIVCTPEDAFRCFMGTDLDVLAIGNCLLRKEAQKASLLRRYEGEFEQD